MEELSFYQALTASSVEYFDLSMERLQKKYLLSKPHVAFRINKYGSVKLLRLIDGNLKEIVLPQIKDTDVVGFGDLTE